MNKSCEGCPRLAVAEQYRAQLEADQTRLREEMTSLEASEVLDREHLQVNKETVEFQLAVLPDDHPQAIRLREAMAAVESLTDINSDALPATVRGKQHLFDINSRILESLIEIEDGCTGPKIEKKYKIFGEEVSKCAGINSRLQQIWEEQLKDPNF